MKRSMVFVVAGVLCVCAWTLTACGSGGGGTTQESQSTQPASTPSGDVTPSADNTDDGQNGTTTSNLPAIVDNYADDFFAYVDRSLYEGSYSLSTDPAETCSATFGMTIPSSLNVTDMTDTQVVITFGSETLTFSAAASNAGADDWGYLGTIKGVECAFVFGSANLYTSTVDYIGLGCVNGVKGCGGTFNRPAANNYSNVTIKGTQDEHEVDEMALVAAAHELLATQE